MYSTTPDLLSKSIIDTDQVAIRPHLYVISSIENYIACT